MADLTDFKCFSWQIERHYDSNSEIKRCCGAEFYSTSSSSFYSTCFRKSHPTLQDPHTPFFSGLGKSGVLGKWQSQCVSMYAGVFCFCMHAGMWSCVLWLTEVGHGNDPESAPSADVTLQIGSKLCLFFIPVSLFLLSSYWLSLSFPHSSTYSPTIWE